jgi:hypothetical protein
MVANTRVEQDGEFSFEGIVDGDYIVAAVAMPSGSQFDAQTVMAGRVAMSPVVHVAPNTATEVALEFK